MTKNTDTEYGAQGSSPGAPGAAPIAPRPDPAAPKSEHAAGESEPAAPGPEPAAPGSEATAPGSGPAAPVSKPGSLELESDAPGSGPTSLDLCAKSPSSNLQDQEPSRELLDQFYSTLRVMYLAARPYPGPNKPWAEQHVRIRCLLSANDPCWNDAYEIEQLLTFVMTDEQLEAELPRRMAEAQAQELQFAGKLAQQLDAVYAEEAKDDASDADRAKALAAKRYILQRLLNDLQWFYNQRMRRRDTAKRLSQRVSALFLSAFLFFFVLLFVQYRSLPVGDTHSDGGVQAAVSNAGGSDAGTGADPDTGLEAGTSADTSAGSEASASSGAGADSGEGAGAD